MTIPERNAIYDPTRTSADITPLLHALGWSGVGLPHSNDTAYEMSDVEDSTTSLTAGASGADTGDVGAFYAEVRTPSARLPVFMHSLIFLYES